MEIPIQDSIPQMIIPSLDYVDQILDRLEQWNPNPKSDLVFSNPFELLVAVVLSAQATDKGVNKVTPFLFAIAPTPQKMVELGTENLQEIVKSIGLYKTKSKNIVALSKILVDSFNGEIPDNRKDLESLPGVGRKSANVILNVAFNQPTLAVDTHVFRVSHRLKLSKGKTPLDVEMDVLPLIHQERLSKAHHLLVLHGRYVCKAKKPMCATCCLSSICPSNIDV